MGDTRILIAIVSPIAQTCHARAKKKEIAKLYTDPDHYPREENPVSVYMAGSPGAGKTETSKQLLASTAEGVGVIRIDPDELRASVKSFKLPE